MQHAILLTQLINTLHSRLYVLQCVGSLAVLLCAVTVCAKPASQQYLPAKQHDWMLMHGCFDSDCCSGSLVIISHNLQCCYFLFSKAHLLLG